MTAFLDNMQETAVGGITRCLLNSPLGANSHPGMGMHGAYQQGPAMGHAMGDYPMGQAGGVRSQPAGLSPRSSNAGSTGIPGGPNMPGLW